MDSFELFFGIFFPHMTHMHAFYSPSKFYHKWSTASYSKSPNTWNFEIYLKLEHLNFEHWQFSISHPNLSFLLRHSA